MSQWSANEEGYRVGHLDEMNAPSKVGVYVSVEVPKSKIDLWYKYGTISLLSVPANLQMTPSLLQLFHSFP